MGFALFSRLISTPMTARLTALHIDRLALGYRPLIRQPNFYPVLPRMQFATSSDFTPENEDEHLFEDDGPDEPYFDAPSPKQLAYAQSLALQVSEPITEDVTTDKDACSRFIEMCLTKAPPTPKQESFARRIADQLNMELPDDVLTSRSSCSQFIDENLYKLPKGTDANVMESREPTPKQIMFAARLAREKGTGLSFEVLSNMGECSKFIDEMLKPGATADASAGEPISEDAGETDGSDQGDDGKGDEPSEKAAGTSSAFRDTDVPF